MDILPSICGRAYPRPSAYPDDMERSFLIECFPNVG